MTTKKAIRQVETTVYVARDGKEFDTEQRCLDHEAILAIDEGNKYVEEHDLLRGWDISDGLWCFITHEYIGDDEFQLMLVKVTQELIDQLRPNKYAPVEALERHMGKLVFLSYSYGDGPYLEGALEVITNSLLQTAIEVITLEKEVTK